MKDSVDEILVNEVKRESKFAEEITKSTSTRSASLDTLPPCGPVKQIPIICSNCILSFLFKELNISHSCF